MCLACRTAFRNGKIRKRDESECVGQETRSFSCNFHTFQSTRARLRRTSREMTSQLTRTWNCFFNATSKLAFSILYRDRGTHKKCILGAIIIIALPSSLRVFLSPSISDSTEKKNNKNVNAPKETFSEFITASCTSFRESKSEWKLFKRQFRELFLNRAIFYPPIVLFHTFFSVEVFDEESEAS